MPQNNKLALWKTASFEDKQMTLITNAAVGIEDAYAFAEILKSINACMKELKLKDSSHRKGFIKTFSDRVIPFLSKLSDAHVKTKEQIEAIAAQILAMKNQIVEKGEANRQQESPFYSPQNQGVWNR